MTIEKLLEKIKHTPDCIVYPPDGIPNLQENLYKLPKDLKKFYELCGGVVLFSSEAFTMQIVSPENFQLANPIIVGELCPDDISSEWYIVAADSNNDYITIDLDNKRHGRCYDSFWDRHGIVGDCQIIASSFTELLVQLYNSQGKCLYWLQDDFPYLGDAYD